MNFLLDNNLPPALAEALHALSKDDGHKVIHLRGRFRFWDKAILLVRWWPRILEQAGLVDSGGFLVPPKYGAKGRFKSVPL